MDISLIIPCYNEEKRILTTLQSIIPFLRQNYKDFEIIVVDDGSCDGTAAKTAGLDNVVTLSYPQNMGKGYAVKYGAERACGKMIVFTDADLSYEPFYIKQITDRLSQHDVVIGSRYKNSELCKDYPPLRRMTSFMFAAFVKGALNLQVTDTQCGIKGFTKNAAEQIFDNVTIRDFGFDVEVLYIARIIGASVFEVPVVMRHSDESKVNVVRDSLKMFKDVFYIRKRFRRAIEWKVQE